MNTLLIACKFPMSDDYRQYFEEEIGGVDSSVLKGYFKWQF